MTLSHNINNGLKEVSENLNKDLNNHSNEIEQICRNIVIQAQKSMIVAANQSIQQNRISNQDETLSGVSRVSKLGNGTISTSSLFNYEDYERELRSEVKKLLSDKQYNSAFVKILSETANEHVNSQKLLVWCLNACTGWAWIDVHLGF